MINFPLVEKQDPIINRILDQIRSQIGSQSLPVLLGSFVISSNILARLGELDGSGGLVRGVMIEWWMGQWIVGITGFQKIYNLHRPNH